VTTRDQERIALAFARDLKRAGIEASVRAVDAVQFDQRRLSFDFDMIQNRWTSRCRPATNSRSIGEAKPRTFTAREITWAQKTRYRRPDRGIAGGA